MTAPELREARRRLGLTGAALAAVLESDLRTIKRWESGERGIPGPAIAMVKLLLASMEARCALGLRALLRE